MAKWGDGSTTRVLVTSLPPMTTQTDTPPASTTPSTLSLLRVFRHRNYRLFFAGQLTSLMGTWMQSVAQGWLVYTMTHSPLLLGLTSFCGQIPVFFIAPFGGTISDRVDRRRLLIVTQGLSMLQAAILATLTLAHVVQVWEIVALAFSMGMINAFDVPTRQAFTIEMVGREDLRNAIALNSVMFNLARVIGPSAAGLLVALAGEGVCFALNALSYAAVLASLVLMQVEPRPRPAPEHPLREMQAGFVYAWRTRPIRVALMLVAVSSCFGAAYLALMPAFARDVLHQGSEGLGFLMASVGVGALGGAYALSRVHDRHLMLTPVLAAAGFGVSLILFCAFALAAAVDGAAAAHRLLPHAAGRVVEHVSSVGIGRSVARPGGVVLCDGVHGHDAVGVAAAGLACDANRRSRGGDGRWRRGHRLVGLCVVRLARKDRARRA